MAIEKVIRHPEFAKRLQMACDQQPHCPPMHRGRLQWIVDQFKAQGQTITTETASKWMQGMARPKTDKNERLAQILGVDAVWLFHGVDQGLSPREVKARTAVVSGLVNLVAGLIQMDGGSVAFPDEGDKAAARDNVDLKAIIRGGAYDIHVVPGEQTDAGYTFVVPTMHPSIVLGVIRDGFSFRIAEVTPEAIAEGQRRGGAIEVVVAELTEITGFDRRL